MTAPYLDPAAFAEARLNGLTRLQQRQGIGTLGERSLHAVLKYWIDPDDSHHEIRLERCVADVFDGRRVTEIQTRGFSALRPKLERLLEAYPVTVVHPLTWHKTLVWVDPASGEASKPRRSPKTGHFWDAVRELVYIRALLGHPRLTVVLPLLDMEEYRLTDGWSADGKKGSHRAERMPTALGPVAVLREKADYACLLPPELPEPFTTADVKRASRLSQKGTGTLVNILYNLDVIQRTGKKGNAFLYQKAP